MKLENIAKTATLLILIFSLLIGCSTNNSRETPISSTDHEYVKQYISRFIQRGMKKNKVTGLSIALIDDQKITWAEGFGYADSAGKIPARPETVYRVGSISKLFTAFASMQLFDQGKLDIDDPLQAYLPEFSVKTRFSHTAPITLRNLLTHHSGLPTDFLKGRWAQDPKPLNEVVNQIHDEYVAYPPNFIYAYSNLGMTFMGHVVERVSGRNFTSYIDESLLLPLGMAHSSFSLKPELEPLLAKGYHLGRENSEPPLRDLPAGGLYSTVLDLSRFIQMIFAQGRARERQIIKPETLTEMLRPQNEEVPLDLDFRIGLGWMLSGIRIRKAGPVAYHKGETLFFHSQLIILPEHKLGVVVLANSSSARGLIDQAAMDALKLTLEVKAGKLFTDKPSLPLRAKIDKTQGLTCPHSEPWSISRLQAYEGHYATKYGLVSIIKRADHLQAKVMGKTLHLIPRSDGRLGLKYKLLGVIPISLGHLDHIGLSLTSITGHDILTARFGGQTSLIGEKIKPAPITKRWQKRLGRYKVANAGEEISVFDWIRLSSYEGILLLEYSLPLFSEDPISVPLTAVSDSEAVILGLGRAMGDTIRVITCCDQEYLSYSGYLFKSS